jgi:gamma-glutamyltranspeptidase
MRPFAGPAHDQYITGEIKGTTRRGTYMEDKMYAPFFDDQGEVLQVGEKYKRVEYARALERIAEKGVDDFYQGEIGQGIIRAVQEKGGLMTMDDINGDSLAGR